MRNELENIERAEKYLNNQLSEAENTAFEKQLKTDADLKKLTENLRDMQTAIFRSALRSKIESNANGGNGWKKAFIIGAILIAIGTLAWFLFPNASVEPRLGQKEIVSNSSEKVESVSEQTESLSDSAQQKTEESATGFNLGGHELWTQPDIQPFRFKSTDGATIEGKDGILIIVPSNAFVDSAGRLVTGKVAFELVEALSVEEMVLYKLQTVSNGSPLESGGMFHLQATIDGKEVQINPKRPLYIEIPTTEKKSGMMAFGGEVGTDGKINWVNPKPLKKYLVKLPLDGLDFLPSGFETEVKGNMPFLSYTETSTSITDSLYYSVKAVREADKRSLPKKWGPTGNSTEYEANEVRCGIAPVSIETIKTVKFEHTFIATKEMEERIGFLHQSEYGDRLLRIYIDNLTKDLWVSDSLVALAADSNWNARFVAFTSEKLTNIKDASMYQKRLSDFYRKKREELKQHHTALSEKLASKNANELRTILSELNASAATVSSSRSPWVASTPNPSAATSAVYATPWYGMGWGNIDRYMKLLNGETVETNILVSNRPNNTDVTQWLGGINTYTDLNQSNGQYRAVFPKRKNGKSSTHVFAVAESGREYTWGMAHYNPYKDSEVEFAMATASMEDIKTDLRGVDMSFGRLRQNRAWIEQQAKQLIIAQMQIRKRREEWFKKRTEIMAKYREETRRQQEIRNVMDKLRSAAFPCDESEIATVSEIEVIEDESQRPDFFIIVEDMPVYPGGDVALQSFIARNTVYPETAKAKGITGVVYVSYIVNATGVVGQIKVVRGVNPLLDAEATRVVSLLTGYTPGRQRGEAVPTQFTMPIRFALD